jgi:type I restriction enzyme S subunit
MNNFNVEKLPEGWEVKSLADIGNIFSGNSINAKLKEEKYTNREGTPYVATKDISYNSVINYDNGINIPFDDVNKFRLAKSETILICAEGGSAGRKVGILNQDVYFVNKLFALETISEVNSKFCFYWYLSKEFKSNFKDKLKGLIGGVSKTDFKNLPIPIPPLEEQKRIVDKIDALFAKIDKAISLTEESLKQAKNFLPSVLKEVFEKGKANGWEEKKLTEICERIFAGGDKPKDYFSKTKTDECSIPIFSNGIKEDGLYGYTKEPKVIKPSVTISARGTIGHTVYRTEPFVPIIRLIVLTPNQEIVSANFLMIVIKNLEILNVGSAIPQLTVPMIKNYSVLVPNQDIQDKISHLVGIYETKITQTQSKLEEQLAYLKQLKSSILSKAFKGEL